ncbi:MAG: hypothetical protein K9H48_07860 [Melioribacteraceae bacterium]|nr:hypothetical protein [Melioribacteraceae bacterium]
MTEENNYFEEIAPPEEVEEVEASDNLEMNDKFEISGEVIEDTKEETLSEPQKDFAVVNVEFKKPTTEVRVISLPTGKTEQALATNKNIKLLKDKQYFIPVDSNEDSDNYKTIKVFSDISNLIEVKYVKDGFACIQVLIHKTVIKDKQRLCILC